MIMTTPDDLKDILDPNETVELYIKQKFYHLAIDIDSVVITNKRVILRHPHALGLKKDYTDFNYMDFENVIIDKGIVRSTIKCTFKSAVAPLLLNDVPNADAQKAYRIIRDNLSRAQTMALTEGTIPETIICSYCGTKNKPDASRCINCGALLK
jgi:ribosomal protein L40E